MSSRTQNEWYRVIAATHASRQRFAGTPLAAHKPGTKVRVVRGLNLGAVLDVVAVVGPAFGNEHFKVYVDVPDGIPTWYAPWDLEPLPEPDPT